MIPTGAPAGQKPIGWYLKEADVLITSFFEEAFDQYCITRFHWMVLRAIKANGYINVEAHHEELKYFIKLERLKGIIDNLQARRWIVADYKNFKFTEKGERLFKAVTDAYEQQLQKMMQGITDEEYNNTIATLSKIIANLDK
jgi:DNA-binding MarR family transcriptional regulator